MKKIRVLVVDDSAFMRKMLSDMLSSDPRIEVIDTARNGEICLEKIVKLQPDVVTLDIEMPVMDGMTTLEEIMKRHPIPVVMVSSVSDSQTKKTLQAISKGAVDFVAKPSGAISLDINLVKEEIISKVITASQAKINREQRFEMPLPTTLNNFQENKSIICIGSSTGGPRALEKILRDLPENLRAPIVIVQHMPRRFTKSLANRLDQISSISVVEAIDHQFLEEGKAYIAPGDYHMRVLKRGTRLQIKLSKEKPKRGHRPSVDVLLQSVSLLSNYNKMIIILTGMGRDGAEGIIQVKEKDQNAFVITESEKTAIINGMPSAARETGYANLTLPVDQIGESLINLLNK